MLDLIKLTQQMRGISQHLTQEASAASRRLDIARQLMQQAQARQGELIALRQQWRDRMGFAAAEPVEPLDTCVDIAPAPPIHTVLATDGSQIAPSHHEVAYCYLINVGRIVLYYGQSRQPLLDSLPEVFYRPEDLYVSRQWGIRTEEWMGYRRTVSEAISLTELAEWVVEQEDWGNQKIEKKRREEESEAAFTQTSLFSLDELGLAQGNGSTPQAQSEKQQKSKLGLSQSPSPLPILALTDGSIIYRFLETIGEEARDRILPEILDAWDRLRVVDVPLVGYVSASRNGDALNFLRLQRCPYSEPDCLTHCPGKTDQAPCQVFDPLRDITLWTRLLQPGQRGALWRSSARILDLYGDHPIYFCYVHVGAEIARIECPAWVAEEPDRLNRALSLTLAQVQKGFGYPVALAEAHNQAVVRGSDRTRFFALLEQEMIRAGLRNVGTSYKEARKRGSIA